MLPSDRSIAWYLLVVCMSGMVDIRVIFAVECGGERGWQYSHEKDSQRVTKPTIVISRHGIYLFVCFIPAFCGLSYTNSFLARSSQI